MEQILSRFWCFFRKLQGRRKPPSSEHKLRKIYQNTALEDLSERMLDALVVANCQGSISSAVNEEVLYALLEVELSEKSCVRIARNPGLFHTRGALDALVLFLSQRNITPAVQSRMLFRWRSLAGPDQRMPQMTQEEYVSLAALSNAWALGPHDAIAAVWKRVIELEVSQQEIFAALLLQESFWAYNRDENLTRLAELYRVSCLV